jgi:Family of unknown function (DUF5343)
MAAALRKGYAQIYERNEYAHDLDKKKLDGLVVELTGLEQGHATVRAIVGTFEALKGFADFNKPDLKPSEDLKDRLERKPAINSKPELNDDTNEDLRINLAYTINLVLPKTDDVAVFNAIFKSLRENLLRK